MYIIGVDGGGTKSRFVFAHPDGTEIGKVVGDTTNLSSNSFDTVLSHIQAAVSNFFTQFPELTMADCAAFCIGSAGVDLPTNVQAMERIIKQIGFTCPLSVVNDSELVLWGETEGKAGVALISGTGSIAFGKNQAGQTARVGGHGHLIADEGSGYWIGMQAINRSLKSYDGMEQDTLLTPLLMQHLHLKELMDILQFVYRPDANKSEIAALSMLVFEAASHNDAVALAIVRQAAQDLVDMALALVRKLENNPAKERYQLILSGGNALKSDLLYAHIQANVEKNQLNFLVSKAQREPVYGAIYLARQML